MTADGKTFERYRAERLVRARPEALWDLITNPHRAPEVESGVKRVEVFTPGPAGPGTRYRQFGWMMGTPVRIDVVIEDFVPFHRVTSRTHNLVDGTRSLDEFLLTPVAGGINLTATSWVVGAGPVRRAVLRLTKPFDRHVVRRTMDRLAAVAERQ